MAKKTKSQMSAMGKQITTIAKRIRKQHPRKKWTECMRAAGKELKSKH